MRTIIISRSNTPRRFGSPAIPAAIITLLATGAASGGEYVVRVDADLAHLEVRALFADPVERLAARSRDAGAFLVAARDCERDAPLTRRGRRLLLPAAGVRCFEYTVDLVAAAKAERRNQLLDPRSRIVAPADWFWRPPIEDEQPLRVRFELPENMNVSVPWRPAGSFRTFEPATSPRSGTAPAVFGHFAHVEREIPGGRLRIALPRGASPYDTGRVADEIARSAAIVAGVHGRFPNASPQVLVLPVGARSGDEAVHFGRVIRDGGETVELMLDETAAPGRVGEGWTATHEFTHLLHPYLRREDRWVTEGLAQYYQNILLARAGIYTEEEAWQKLLAGLERGRQSMPWASPAAASASGERAARMKIYWSGAALALMADVELRRRSAGRRSLDTALAGLARCCLPSPRAWSAGEFYGRLDTETGEPVFLALHASYADRQGFPDISGVLEALGVEAADGTVTFNESASLAALRRALTAPR